MKATDYNTDYENNFPEENNDFDFDNGDDYTLTRIEEEYANGDTYNFFPDAAF